MKYKYWLANIKGIGNIKISYLLKECNSEEEIYYLSKDSLMNIYGINQKDAQNIVDSKKSWDLDKKWMELNEKGINFMTITDEKYPQRLKNIINSPYALYYIGKLPEENTRVVSMVGARGRSAYGSEVARSLSKALAQANIPVVSGMARGIDTDAHMGALQGGGETYAVLGCGVDVCYPKENKYIYDEIPKKGGIISEYPLTTAPNPRLFPMRNRIISALSDYVIVVEARQKSGSLITAYYAMEQGKEVYVVPGRITDPLSFGCNKLIHQGAGIITNVSDFLEEMQILDKKVSAQINFRKNSLEKDEMLVYSLLDFCPIGLGTLMDRLPFKLIDLLDIMERLEDKGFIKETVPNYYIKTL